MEDERKRGRIPKEMPPKHPGYDVESCTPAGAIERYIEVKGKAGDWDSLGVGLTRRQFSTATELKASYWLYVVERAESEDYKIYRIQDPATRVDQFLYDEGWEQVAEVEAALASAKGGTGD
jgi:hypothetical protein